MLIVGVVWLSVSLVGSRVVLNNCSVDISGESLVVSSEVVVLIIFSDGKLPFTAFVVASFSSVLVDDNVIS